MSAPDLVLREADQLRYGVLSLKAAKVLRNVLQHAALTGDDCDTLRQAAEFLAMVADGQQITTNGTFRAGSRPSQSIEALDLAEIPIGMLKISSKPAAIAAMASAVSSSANNRLRSDRRKAVQNAQHFFEALHGALQQRSELRRMIGGRNRRLAA